MPNRKKVIVMLSVAALVLLSVVWRLHYITGPAINELGSVRDLVCDKRDISLDLMYIPYSVRTRVPISVEQFEAVYMKKIQIKAEEGEIIEAGCESLRKLKAEPKFDSSFSARWGLIGYSDTKNRLFALYGDGKGHCALKGMIFSCSKSMDIWVQNQFLAIHLDTQHKGPTP